VSEAVGRRALWWIPLVAGLLPAVGALAALLISIRLELIPACIPFVDGCVSISRAARHDLANHLFRAFALPAAALQAITWLLCVSWLRSLGAASGTALPLLAVLGVFAGMFLVLYGTFLGTEGQAYRWMRRYGIFFYFGFTGLCMIIAAGRLHRVARMRRAGALLVALCALVLAICLADVFSPLYLSDEAFRDRMGNAIEWNAALIFTLYFFALAWLWRATRFGASFAAEKRAL
jgi:hypothetical protein